MIQTGLNARAQLFKPSRHDGAGPDQPVGVDGTQQQSDRRNSGGQYYMARILGYTPAVVDADGGAKGGGGGGFGRLFQVERFQIRLGALVGTT